MNFKKDSAAAATLWLVSALVCAQEATRVRVEFDPGTHRKTVEGSIEGHESFDYILPGETGQQLSVRFRSSLMGAYINIFPPGSDAAMHIGANLGNRFDGVLPETGDYRVHVFLMPNAASRGDEADFTIELALEDSAPSRDPDFADGLSGGPDFFRVTGIANGEKLNVRSGAATSDDVVSQVENGALLRNLGCRMEAGSRWCHVQTLDEGSSKVEGWVAGRFLEEAPDPISEAGGTTVRTRDDPDAPELFVRSSGEIEVNFKAGCGALYGSDGTRITAGASCSAEQLRQASEAVQAYRR